MTPGQRANLTRLLSPRHIAFIGGRDAIVAIKEAERRGFLGPIWAANPGRSTMGGYQCYGTVADLPEPPDAVFLAIPAPAAVESLRQLAAMGAGGAVCYSAGFREAGPAGAALERELIAAAGDMAVIGPNCYGVINYLDRVALWPFAHGGETPGWGAAIITQSGMLSSDITMAQRSLPITHMISAGNQSVLTIEDFIDHLAEHPAVRAIGVHIEGIRDARRFEAACLKALDLGVPVVALKTGKSRIGASLTVSHTGSLSGSDDLHEALFARCNVIRVKNPSELVETLKFLCISGAPAGGRVAGFTCSGGGATMLADHAESIGLSFPEFTVTAREEIAALLPPIATVSNPLDYTTPIWGQPDRTAPVFDSSITLLGADAALLVQDYPAEGLDESRVYYLNDAKAFIAAARARGIPAAICSTLPENIDAETRRFLIDEGVAPMQGIDEALNAVRAACRWSQMRRSGLTTDRQPLVHPVPECGTVPRDEAAGKAIVAKLGLRIPKGRVVTGKDVTRAALETGFPVVLKMMGPRLAHKSEAGAVAIGIADANALAAALAQMRLDVAAHDPSALTDTFLVEEMMGKPMAELLLSVRRDVQFGVALTIGAGGVLTELLSDTATLLLPTTPDEVINSLMAVRIGRLLKGYRGGGTVDIPRLAEDICRFASAAAASTNLAEIEINPLFVGKNGSIVAVDALVYERDTK
jgi:acyl-CoA synthetase (NDP forming)